MIWPMHLAKETRNCAANFLEPCFVGARCSARGRSPFTYVLALLRLRVPRNLRSGNRDSPIDRAVRRQQGGGRWNDRSVPIAVWIPVHYVDAEVACVGHRRATIAHSAVS